MHTQTRLKNFFGIIAPTSHYGATTEKTKLQGNPVRESGAWIKTTLIWMITPIAKWLHRFGTKIYWIKRLLDVLINRQ
jgi:hypothetical protein